MLIGWLVSLLARAAAEWLARQLLRRLVPA